MVQPSVKYLPLLLTALLVSLPAVAQRGSGKPQNSPQSSSREVICCHDASSQRVCGDTLPSQCKDRAYKVYNQQGILLREVAPPLTAAERAARDQAAEKQKQVDAAAREQRRKDQALRETYSNVDDIDRMRAQTEADIRKSIAESEARLAAAIQRRKKLMDEAEFYPRGDMPANIAKGLRDEEVEIKAQQDMIASKKLELDAAHRKYDEDKRRYLEISRPRATRVVTPDTP